MLCKQFNKLRMANRCISNTGIASKHTRILNIERKQRDAAILTGFDLLRLILITDGFGSSIWTTETYLNEMVDCVCQWIENQFLLNLIFVNIVIQLKTLHSLKELKRRVANHLWYIEAVPSDMQNDENQQCKLAYNELGFGWEVGQNYEGAILVLTRTKHYMDNVATAKEENVSDHKWKFDVLQAGGTFEKCFAPHNLKENLTLNRLEEDYLGDALMSVVENSQSISSINRCQATLCKVDSSAMKLETCTAVMESKENLCLTTKAAGNVEKTTDNVADLETSGCATAFVGGKENFSLFANLCRTEEKSNTQVNTLSHESSRPVTQQSREVEQRVCKEQCVKEKSRSSTSVRKRLSGLQANTKSVLLHVFFMLCCATKQPMVSALPGNSNHQTLVKTYPVLMTPQCESVEIMKMSICPLDKRGTDIYITFCGFDRLCAAGTKPVCIDTTDGMRYICSEDNLSCSAGYWMHTWVEEKNPFQVKMKEEKCPPGRYQPTNSFCFHACRFVHQELASLGEHFEVYSEGDHEKPTLVYCNYKLGFFNPHGRFLLDFDDKGFHLFVCSNVKDFDPCGKHQAPLPNGTCVEPCEEGYVRDNHDDFHCKDMQGFRPLETERKIGHAVAVNTGGDTNSSDQDEEWHSLQMTADVLSLDRNAIFAAAVLVVCLLLLLVVAVRLVVITIE